MKRYIAPLIFLLIFSLLNVNVHAQSLSGAPPVVVNPQVVDPNGYLVPFAYNASGEQEFTLGCGVTSVEMIARFNDVGTTDSYTVEEIPYAARRFDLPAPGDPGEQIPSTIDDQWSGVNSLASGGVDMDFCFFQNQYNQFVVNSNGAVSFDTSLAGTGATWVLQDGGVPRKLGFTGNTQMFPNAIFTPFHDIDPADEANLGDGNSGDGNGYIYWNILGTAPNRIFIMGIFDITMYDAGDSQCDPNFNATHQMVFYETTNIIEMHILEKPVCSWNGGMAVVGIQNQAMDTSFPAQNATKDRDTSVWSVDPTDPESWRFIPNGGTVRPTFAWYEGYVDENNVGTLISTNPQHTFTPTADTVYTAEIRYIEACSGLEVILAQDINITLDNALQGEIVDNDPPNDPVENIFFCAGSGDTFTVLADAVDNSGVAGNTISYTWTQVSTNTVVGNTSTLLIDSATLGATEVFEVNILLEDAAGVDLCDISDSVTVNVSSASFQYASTSYCSSTDPDPAPVNVTPPGGVFTISNGGVIDAATGVIDLMASGSGTDMTGDFTITYTVGTAPNTCDATFDVNIGGGSPSLDYAATFCITATNPTPTSFSPAGGTFTIDNGATIDSATGEVDLVSLAAGNTYEVTYTTSGVCGGSVMDTFDVTASADASFTYPATICLSVAASLLPDSVTTGGGNFTIDNGGTIDVTTGDLAGNTAGNYNVTYTTVGCVDTETVAVTINAVEDASFSFVNAAECAGDGNVTAVLAVSATTGGTFTINNGGTIDAATGEVTVDALAVASITYDITYTTPGPCPESTTEQLTINPEDDASFSYVSSVVCIADANPTPNSVATPGGTFTIDNGGIINTSTGEVDLAASGAGAYTITYDTTSAGNACPNMSTFAMTISAQDDTAFGYDSGIVGDPEDFCVSDMNSGLPNPLPATAGGTYTINGAGVIDAATGVIDFMATPASSTPYTVTYTTTGSCANSSTFDIVLHSDEVANFNYDNVYCITGANPTPTITATTGGEFSIDNGGVFVDTGTGANSSSGEIDMAATGLGTDGTGSFTITYQTLGAFCRDSDTYNITILNTPDITPTADVTECGGYTLPAIAGTGLTGNEMYYTAMNGGGTAYAAGTLLAYADFPAYPVTLYIYDETGTVPNCSDEESFDLTINIGPVINPMADQEHCDNYLLPTITGVNLSGNESYYTGMGGTGTAFTAGTTLNFGQFASYPVTLYIYDETGTVPNCDYEESFQLTLNRTPIVDPMANQTVCDSYTLPAITGTGLTGNEMYYDATGGGGTAYAAGTTLNFADFATYPVILYVYDQTATTPNCTDEESFALTINATPDITALADQEHCDTYTLPAITGTNLTGNESYYTAMNGGGTAYTAGTTLNFTDFATYPVTLYIYDETATTPNCSDEESFALTINATPDVAVQTNQEVCDSYTLPTIAGISLSGNEMYYDGPGGTGTAYAAGTTLNFADFATYPVTLYAYDTIGSAGNECTDEESFTLIIHATPNITNIGDQEECGSFVLPAITGTNLSGGESYYTAPGGGGTAYAAGATINYADFPAYPVTLYVFDQLGVAPNICTNEVSFDLTLHLTPILDGLANQEECDSFTLPAITGTNLTGNEMYYTATNGGGTAYAAGTTLNFADFASYPVTLFIYDETGSTPNCFDEETFDLTINATPAITALANQEHCDSYTLPAITGTNLTGNEMYYTASGGLGGTFVAGTTFNYADFASYPVTLFIYDATGTTPNCSNETSFTLTLNATPDITALADQEECDSFILPTIAGVDLTASASYYTAPNGGGIAYAAGTTLNYADFASYPVTLYMYDETGTTPNCSDEESFMLTINATPNIVDLADVTFVCDSYTLPAITGTDLTGSESYYTAPNGGGTAYAAGTTLSYTDFAPGDYPITLYMYDTVGSAGNECTSQQDFTLNIVPTDDPAFTYVSSICISDANPFPTSFATAGGTFSIDQGASIVSNTGEIDLTSTVGGTTYTVTYTTNGVCPNSSTFQITVDASVDASIVLSDNVICINDGTNPQAAALFNMGGTFSINFGATIDPSTGIIDLSSTVGGTIYTVEYTVDNGNCADTQSAQIEVTDIPYFELPFQAFICPTPGIETNISVENPAGSYTYEWFDSNGVIVEVGETLTLDDPSEVGIYTVTATVATSDPTLFCTSSQLVSVGLADQAIIADVHVNDFNRPNNTITIEVTGGTGDFTYIITDRDGNDTTQVNNPVFENVMSEVYQIQVVDNQGCSLAMIRNDIAVLDYPLFFTPNGDTYYDTWQINNSNLIPNSDIYIFDRFGKVLAKIDPNGLGWDGTYLGKQLPATDYWFTAEYLDPNTNIPRTVRGHFSIVRKGEI